MAQFNSETGRRAGKNSSRKGIPNHSTAAVREAIAIGLDSRWSKLWRELDTLEGKDYVANFIKLLEFTTSKMRHVEENHSFNFENLTDAQIEGIMSILFDKKFDV